MNTILNIIYLQIILGIFGWLVYMLYTTNQQIKKELKLKHKKNTIQFQKQLDELTQAYKTNELTLKEYHKAIEKVLNIKTESK